MDDAAEFVVHQRTGVNANQRLCSRPDVIRGQIRAVGKLRVDQAVNRNRRVRSDLDKAVEGEGEAVVEFICQVLQKTRIVDGNIKRQVTGVDEVGVLRMCLGCQHLCWIALVVAHEFGLCLQTTDKVEEVLCLIFLGNKVG